MMYVAGQTPNARLDKEDMGVSKNSGTPKWMVYKENPIKMDDLGGPLFLETPILSLLAYFFDKSSTAV